MAALRPDQRHAEIGARSRRRAGGRPRPSRGSSRRPGPTASRATGRCRRRASAVDGARVPSASLPPGPATARTTSSSPSSRRTRRRRPRAAPACRTDLVDHGAGSSSARARGRPGELLGELARAALALEQLAALERTARGAASCARELDGRRRTRARREEDEHEPSSLAPGLLERDGQQRAAPGGRRRGPEAVAEALVVAETPGRQHLAAAGTRRQRRRALAEVRREPLRELVGAGQQRRAGAAEHGRGVAAERLGRGLRDRVERLRSDSGSPSTAAIR